MKQKLNGRQERLRKRFDKKKKARKARTAIKELSRVFLAPRVRRVTAKETETKKNQQVNCCSFCR